MKNLNFKNQREIELKEAPSDTISSLKFSLKDNILLCSSWDNVIKNQYKKI